MKSISLHIMWLLMAVFILNTPGTVKAMEKKPHKEDPEVMEPLLERSSKATQRKQIKATLSKLGFCQTTEAGQQPHHPRSAEKHRKKR